jgi:hypothetical protein
MHYKNSSANEVNEDNYFFCWPHDTIFFEISYDFFSITTFIPFMQYCKACFERSIPPPKIRLGIETLSSRKII